MSFPSIVAREFRLWRLTVGPPYITSSDDD